jgi:hypothetical protein
MPDSIARKIAKLTEYIKEMEEEDKKRNEEERPSMDEMGFTDAQKDYYEFGS